jgi:hypothetical protein
MGARSLQLAASCQQLPVACAGVQAGPKSIPKLTARRLLHPPTTSCRGGWGSCVAHHLRAHHHPGGLDRRAVRHPGRRQRLGVGASTRSTMPSRCSAAGAVRFAGRARRPVARCQRQPAGGAWRPGGTGAGSCCCSSGSCCCRQGGVAASLAELAVELSPLDSSTDGALSACLPRLQVRATAGEHAARRLPNVAARPAAAPLAGLPPPYPPSARHGRCMRLAPGWSTRAR